jgi:hypothetical protein
VGRPPGSVTARCSRPRHPPLTEQLRDLILGRTRMTAAQPGTRHPLTELVHVQSKPQPLCNPCVDHKAILGLLDPPAGFRHSRQMPLFPNLQVKQCVELRGLEP